MILKNISRRQKYSKKAAERAKKTTEGERNARKSDDLYAEASKAVWRTKNRKKVRNIAATLFHEQSDCTQSTTVEWKEFQNVIVEDDKKS